MAESRPASQVLSQVFSEAQLKQYSGLATYLQDGGSIFPLVEKGVRGLVRDHGVSPDDARRFLRRANSMAIYLRRRFIEHTLYGDETQVTRARSGLLSMVEGPSFEQLFSPRFDEMCPPDALESLASPVAYLIELLRWISDRIEAVVEPEPRYQFNHRRQDLARLSVDFNAVHQSVSAVDIIVAVLETFIETQTSVVTLDDSLIEARYPNGLPYYKHWVTVDAVARHHGLSVGDFSHRVSINYPYFLQARSWDDDAGRALAHATRFGPYQRTLLTEAPPAVSLDGSFFVVNFGTSKTDWKDINKVPVFGERTKLDTPKLEAFLSVRAFAPSLSPNVVDLKTAPSDPGEARSWLSGSVYINANTSPGIKIDEDSSGEMPAHRLSSEPDSLAGLQQFDRMNRKVRLDQWLDLPCDQVDALLTAAMRADCRAKPGDNQWVISDNVIQALGLFQQLRERYGCTAQDFAAFIDEFSLYGRGDTLSQFDQIFNGEGGYRRPLLLDGADFPVMPAQGEPDLTVTQICSALAIDLKTYAYLALTIAAAQGKTNVLKRDAPTLSSFFRLVKLPRLLGITPVEGILMLSLLGDEAWVEGLANIPRIGSDKGVPDALNLIYAMHACVEWCADCKLPMFWMLQQVAPPEVPTTTDENNERLFEQVRNLLTGALFTNSALLMAGVPALPGASWLELMTVLVDADGLVISPSDGQVNYPEYARPLLDNAVKDGLGEDDVAIRALIVEQMLTVLMQAREAQVSVVKQTLAVYAAVNTEQTLLLLEWANATVYRFLREIFERVDPIEASGRGRHAPSDPLLMLLADLRRRSAVVIQLDLSAELLRDYLIYGHLAWLDQTDKHAFTARTLYYLTVLTRAFELSGQPADNLLDYLRVVHTFPDPFSDDAKRIAQQAAAIRLAALFDWSVQEVRECVERIAPNLKILQSLPQLDLLMRVRVLAARTGMDALTIFLMGTLQEKTGLTRYEEAAELALPSLTETAVPVPVPTIAEDLKRIVNMTCTVDNTEVVANKPGATITFTVTLTDIDRQPLSGVFVYWRAALGSMTNAATSTDGTVQVTFTPGKVMGTDTPMFWIDLFEPEYAPTIHLIADFDSLQFPPRLKARVPLDPVPSGAVVELYATLMDRYQNQAKNSLIRWTYEETTGTRLPLLIIRPEQAFTNQESVTRVFVSSPTGGQFTIFLTTESGEASTEFEPITFEE